MKNEIIYTTAKPKPEAPIVKAPAAAPAPPAKRITWGIHGRLHMPATADQPQQSSDSSSRSSSRAMRSAQSRSMPSEKTRVRMGYVDRGSRLERLPEQRLLYEKLGRQAAQSALEHLTILHSQSAEKYWIADAETGEVFLSQAFATLRHCHEAAAEVEGIFHMAEVLKSRPAETMESVGELVREHWLRERVAVALGEVPEMGKQAKVDIETHQQGTEGIECRQQTLIPLKKFIQAFADST